MVSLLGLAPRISRASSLPWPTISLELITSGLDQPDYVTDAHDGSGRLFVLCKAGPIAIVRGGAPLPTPFLDLTALVGSRGPEVGLLGLAFHPKYVANGFFYVEYTDHTGDLILARYQVSADNPDVANPDSAKPLLVVKRNYFLHNGGQLAFGPDGYLYVGLGDGGGVGDSRGQGQSKSVLHGKLLRLDVDGGSPYAVPPDNPFVNDPSSRPEIWAYGLRNPWRFSFDRATGDIYIADVGENLYEEIDLQRGKTGGQNYGWNTIEGRHCYPPNASCQLAAYVGPIAEYDHTLGCAVIGGYVYRGPSFPQLNGLYFFGDFCSGRIWALREQEAGQWQQQEVLHSASLITSFGEDEAGELYLTSMSDSSLYQLSAGP